MLKKKFTTLTGLISLYTAFTASFAQTPNMNQAAVDTLTKDVAMAVFANQQGANATEILNQLSVCGDGCDAVAIIRSVGGWDAVGVKMEELGRLKNTAPFQAMSPGDANAAIRREFARFYNRYKRDKNYGVPLSQLVQAQLLAKIDGMLPPTVAPPPVAPTAGQPADGQVSEGVAVNENANIDSDAIRISQLERSVKEERSNRIWMIILSAIAGLLVGAGVVYFMLYRALKNEVDRLTNDNTQLSRELDAAKRAKVVNAPRQPQPENRRRADVYPPQRPDVPPAEPTVSVAPAPLPSVRAETPVPGATGQDDPVAESTAAEPVPAPVSAPSPARSDVFYFPPPDPNGQFDNAHRADALSPESAYRFSTSGAAPDAATFRFEAEPGRVARFLTYRNYMIEPACDSENSFSSTYTRIINRRDGEAVLENGVWRVKTKALIRYE